MRRTTPFILATVLSVLLTACGGGSDEGSSDEAKPYVDAMSKSMAEGDSPMDEDQSVCFSEKFIDVVGIEKVKEAGTPEEFAGESDDLDFAELDLTEDQGSDIYDNFDECGVDLRAEMLDEMSADESMSDEAKTCVEDAVTDDSLREFFVTSMVKGEEAVQEEGAGGELMTALMGCMMSGAETPSSE